MSTPEDRPSADSGEQPPLWQAPARDAPQPPGWDAPPQPPAWDRPAQNGPAQDGPQGYGPPPGYGPPAGYGPPPGYGAPAGYGPPPGYGGYGGPPQTESKAVVALVLAIASFVVFPVLPAIAALFVAGAARRDIDASGGRLTGDGLITGAKVTAWVNIGLCVLGVLLIGLAFGLLAGTGVSEGGISGELELEAPAPAFQR